MTDKRLRLRKSAQAARVVDVVDLVGAGVVLLVGADPGVRRIVKRRADAPRFPKKIIKIYFWSKAIKKRFFFREKKLFAKN